MKQIVDPLSVNGILQPVQTVLRTLASQENCDGEPYDQMMEAADYIDQLEEFIKYCHDLTVSRQSSTTKLEMIHYKCDQIMEHTK